MEKYQRGKIYAIICRKTGRQYIGSTCEPTLAKRLAQHVVDFKYWKEGRRFPTSFEIIKDGDYYIVLLESYPCNSKDELRMCEQKHIDSCDCVNKVKAYQSEEELIDYKKQYNVEYYKQNCNEILEQKKQYYHQNRDKISEYKKQYHEKNRDEINAKAREKVCCPHCNNEINKNNLTRHIKTHSSS